MKIKAIFDKDDKLLSCVEMTEENEGLVLETEEGEHVEELDIDGNIEDTTSPTELEKWITDARSHK